MSAPPKTSDVVQSHTAELSEVLQMFVHELRTPVSASLGYLKLLQGDRVSDPEIRAHALTRSIEGLARIGRLCEEAAAYAEVDSIPVGRHALADFIAALEAACAEAGLSVRVAPESTSGWMQAMAPAAAADAVVTVLRAERLTPEHMEIHVGVVAGAVVVSTAEIAVVRDLENSGGTVPFNPWRHTRGFPPAQAARRLAACGAVIRADSRGGSIAIYFEQEFA
ncbi:MAG: histidine kinase dimerization/phospho-acceptor domain-containing protein [Vicinamibacterales bacterium]